MWSLALKAIAVLALLTGLVYGFIRWEDKLREDGKNACIADNAKAVADALQVERAKEAIRSQQREQALSAAIARAKASDAAAVRARAANVSLQSAIAAASRRAADPNTSPAERSKTTATLGELFGICSQRYQGLGVEADVARNAGLLCESFYKSSETPVSDKIKAIK